MYLNDVISFEKSLAIMFLKNLLLRLSTKQVLFNYPKYLQIDYTLMKCIFIYYPTRQTVPTTWKFDVSFLQNLI